MDSREKKIYEVKKLLGLEPMEVNVQVLIKDKEGNHSSNGVLYNKEKLKALFESTQASVFVMIENFDSDEPTITERRPKQLTKNYRLNWSRVSDEELLAIIRATKKLL